MSQEQIDDLASWIRTMGERGLYPKTTARFRASAIETLTSVLEPGEAKDLASISENLKELGQRWATLKHANPKTAGTYVSRARTALEDYFQYQDNPSSFQGRRRQARADADADAETETKTKAAQNQPKRSSKRQPKVPTDNTPEQVRRAVTLRTFPLKGHQDFEYALPPEGITVLDALRVFYHLVTLARDFDPTDPKQMKLFSQVKTTEREPS